MALADVSAECPLSARELDVLWAAQNGSRAKQIASKLYISESCVRSHLHHIYRKLCVTGLLEASRVAQDRGWLDRPAERWVWGLPAKPKAQEPAAKLNAALPPSLRTYLDVFEDAHLHCRDNDSALEWAKRRTDAAMMAVRPTEESRSVPSRDWMLDRLLPAIMRLGRLQSITPRQPGHLTLVRPATNEAAVQHSGPPARRGLRPASRTEARAVRSLATPRHRAADTAT